MYHQFLFLLFLLSAILNLSLAAYGWLQRRLPGATAFSVAMVIFALLPLMQALNELSSDPSIKIMALKSRVDAAGIAATAWMIMMIQLTGYTHLVNRRLLVAVSIIPLAMSVLNWTENPLFRSGYYVVSTEMLRWSTGPIFWVAFAYLSILLLAPIYLLWRAYGHVSPLSLKQTLALSLSVILPILINIPLQLNLI